MNRRNCMNCETAWRSVADHELEAPHTCPNCGDELVAAPAPQLKVISALDHGTAAEVRHLAA